MKVGFQLDHTEPIGLQNTTAKDGGDNRSHGTDKLETKVRRSNNGYVKNLPNRQMTALLTNQLHKS